MRLLFKCIAAGTVASVGGGAATAYRLMVSRSPPDGMVELPAAEYNAVQDGALLAAVLRSKAALADSGAVLYELRSCPFCAKVKAVLDHHGVPYASVLVDPVSLHELNGGPYRQVPQLQFRNADAVAAATLQSGSRADKAAVRAARAAAGADAVARAHDEAAAQYPQMAKGPVLVDSDAILERLAAPLGFAADVGDADIAARSAWVARDVVRSTFGVANNSLARSATFLQMCTGPEWHEWLFYRTVGTVALRAIAKYKVIPRLGVDDVDAALAAELRAFAAELDRRGRPFHGGGRPDLADLHLFGVVRSAAAHPSVRLVLHGSGAEPWYERVEALVPEGGGATVDA